MNTFDWVLGIKLRLKEKLVACILLGWNRLAGGS